MTLNEYATRNGFDPGWLAKLVAEHGQQVLKLLNDALAEGFSPALIQEAVTLGGEILLEIMTGHMRAVRRAQARFDPNANG